MDRNGSHKLSARLSSVRSKAMSSRLRLESLEGREVPAILTVTNGNDSGAGSLRDAIATANGDGTADTINFDPSVSTVSLTSGGLSLSGDITIDGSTSSTGQVTVLRIKQPLAFNIFVVTTTGVVSLQHLTITGGVNAYGGGIRNNGIATVSDSTIENNTASMFGGGIYNFGTMTVINSKISSNSAKISAGGGLFNSNTMTLVNTTVANNISKLNGGGIGNFGPMTVTNSTIDSNSTIYGSGGGIQNFRALTVTNSTISNNTSSNGSAGGINNVGQVALINSTVANNKSLANGGGIVNDLTLLVTNSTIANNSAATGNGGGIYTDAAASGSTLNNTIVAKNTGGDLGNAAYTGSNNFIGDNLNLGGLTNTISGDPLLGSLQNNGGPTQTMALQSGSPAIDAGDNSLAVDASGAPLQTDQRGEKRISGFAVDIGAFEVQLTASDMIDRLRAEVVYYSGVDGLTIGQMNSLVVKLDQASLALAKGNVRVAYNLIGSFYNEVLSYQASGVLPASDANVLLSHASTIQQALLDLGI